MPYDKATNSYYVDPALEAQQQQLLMQAAAPTKLQQKQSKLQAKLAGLLQDSSYNQGSSNLNNLTAEQQQLLLSDMNDAALYPDGNGGYYQIDPITQAKIPYTKTNKYGQLDTRDLYIGQTADDYMKLGLARTDRGGFKGTYDGSGGSTVHKTGPKGIKPGQDPLFNITLPYDTATMYEQLTHQNIGQIKNRVGGPTKRSDIQKALGDGYSEYTTQNAPLWNIGYKDDGTQLERVTARPHEGDTYVMENARLHQQQGNDPLFVQGQPATGKGYNLDSNDNMINEGIDIGKALVEGAANIVPSITDIPTMWYEALGGKDFEKGSSFEKEHPDYSSAMRTMMDITHRAAEGERKLIHNVVGYDDTKQRKLMEDVGKAFDEEKYVSGMLDALVHNPAGALEMGAQFYSMSRAMAIKGLRKVPAIVSAFTSTAQDSAQRFEAKYGRQRTPEELKFSLLTDALTTAVDSAASSYIFRAGGGDKVATGLGKAVEAGIAKLGLPKVIDLLSTKTIKILADNGVEGFQEALQEAGTQFSGGATVDEMLDKEHLKKTYLSGVQGFASTPGMKAADIAVATASKVKPKEVVSNIKNAFKRDNYVDEKALYEDNPDLDKDELKEAVRGVKEAAGASLATPSSDDLADTPLEPQEAPSRDVSAAVVGATKKVADVQDEGVEESEDLKKFTDEFDTEYNTFVNNFRGMTAGIKDGSATTDEFNPDDFVNKVNSDAKNIIDYFMEVKEDMQKAGAGPKRLAAVQDKINALAALTTAQTTDEMHTIIHSNKTSTPAKVSSVLGSSAATIDDIDAVLKQEDLNEVQRTSLEAKKDILKNVRNVGKEKLFGTGSKPGVFTWISRLASGKVDKATVNGINDFIAGQVSKLDTFKNAVDKWDSENKMPWADPSHPDYEAYNDPKNHNYKTLNNPNSLNSKYAIRRSIMDKKGMLNKLREPIKVEYGDIVRRNDIQQTAGLVDTLEAEHKAMMKLQDALDLALGARKGTKKASKVEEGTKGPVEDKKAPTSSESKTADTAEKPVKKEPYRAPSEEDISKMTANEVTRAQKELVDAVGDDAPTTEDSLVAAQLKMRAEDLSKQVTEAEPKQEKVTIRPIKSGEVSMADTTPKITDGMIKGIKHFISTDGKASKLIEAANIDIMDC